MKNLLGIFPIYGSKSDPTSLYWGEKGMVLKDKPYIQGRIELEIIDEGRAIIDEKGYVKAIQTVDIYLIYGNNKAKFDLFK